MPDNEWAERLYIELFKGGCIEYGTIEMDKAVKIITQHAAPEFAVLEKALEMACSSIKDCRYGVITREERRQCKDCYDMTGDELKNKITKCYFEYFIAKAREEVGYE